MILAVIVIHGNRSERKISALAKLSNVQIDRASLRVERGCQFDEHLHRLARTASGLLGRRLSAVRGGLRLWLRLRLLLGAASALFGGSGSWGCWLGFVGVGIGGGHGLARTASSLLRRRDGGFSFNLGVLFVLDFGIVGRKRLARTASSLLRGVLFVLDFSIVGRKRLARTASSLLRSSFGLFFLLGVVVDKSGLLRAASGFLCGSFVFVVSVGSLLAASLLRSRLGRLIVMVMVMVIVVGVLSIGGTATFLASRLLRAASLSLLGIVSTLRRAKPSSTLLVERTSMAAFSVAERNMPCLDLPV
jgi:hypothetical protein